MEAFDKNIFSNNERPTGKKKMILIGIIVCIVLIVILAVLILFYKQIDATTFKLYIDGTQVSCSDDFYIQDNNGNIYIKARELADLIGWSYQNGEYGSYTEDTNSGYMQNEYEVASFVAGSNELKKYIVLPNDTDSENEEEEQQEENSEEATIDIEVNSENGTLETMELELPIISSNNQIYIPLSAINDICNCSYNSEEYRMYIYELNYLIQLALQNAPSFGYSSVSGTYENLRALAYGMMVAIDNSGRYGVVNLQTGENYLGFKYSEMVFNQNVKEFFVKATDDTVGVVSYDGTVIISPKNYDNISVLSDKLGLYLIEKDSQYGVLNRQGDTVVYPEYDNIGLSDKETYVFDYGAGDNKYVLFDNTIVVNQDEKYGLYNIEGKNTLSVNFQGIGYITESDLEAYENLDEDGNTNDDTDNLSDSNDNEEKETSENVGNSVLTINAQIELDNGNIGAVQGIVVEQTGLNGEPAYGVYDAIQEKLIIPCGCTRIYSTTRAGVTTYYMEYEGQQLEFEDYIKSNNLYTEVENTTSADTLDNTNTTNEVDENVINNTAS